MLSKLSTKTKTTAGIIILIIGLFFMLIINKYNVGFFGGFFAGATLSLGIGLLVTRNYKGEN